MSTTQQKIYNKNNMILNLDQNPYAKQKISGSNSNKEREKSSNLFLLQFEWETTTAYYYNTSVISLFNYLLIWTLVWRNYLNGTIANDS